MEPEAPFRGQVFSVTAITLAIKQMMEGVFRGVFVEGEVSNLRPAASGHLYFNLKDREALLSAVMFKWDARKYGAQLEEGMQVRVGGDLTCYAKQGHYQIVVRSVEALTKGNLFLEFEKLKKKLEQEGLFAPEHKKEIPTYPQRIAVITSPTGAAVRILEELGVARHFDRIIGGDSEFPLKPEPDALTALRRQADAPAEACWVFGDH